MDFEALQAQMSQVLCLLQKGKDSPEEYLPGQQNIHGTHLACMTIFFAPTHLIAYVRKSLSCVLDSGATDHICISMHLMHSVRKVVNPIILSLPNGNSASVVIEVVHRGN